MSLRVGDIPEDWKFSTVTVIHKKGRKDCVENYRPISLTCVACKVMESLIRDQLMNYFLENNLISDFQYGFVKGRSTMLQLLKILDELTTCLEHGGQIDIIYTDFEKAFDKVPHKRLLSKLYSYGVNEELILWIKSFLCHRNQRIKIKDALSSVKPVLSGIPQGTILGPILFLIFINDMPNVCENLSRIYLFADDAKLYKHILINDDYIYLKESCQNMFDWSAKWCMNLNISKCKILSIARNKHAIVNYDYGFNIDSNTFVLLDHIDDMKDLGIILDTELSFSKHIYEKISKAYQMLGIINRNFKHTDKHTFLLLYISLVRSHLEYANSVWCPYKIGLIFALEKVQKRATKMIGACKKLHYSDRLKFLNLPTLKLRRLRGDMIEVYKILNGVYDLSVSPILVRNLDSRTRGNSLKLVHSRSKYDLRKYSFCSRVVGAWNSLPDCVVTANSVNAFKNNIDKHWRCENMYFDWEANIAGCTF